MPKPAVNSNMFLPYKDNPGQRAVMQNKSNLNKIHPPQFIKTIHPPKNKSNNIDKEIYIDEDLSVSDYPLKIFILSFVRFVVFVCALLVRVRVNILGSPEKKYSDCTSEQDVRLPADKDCSI